MGGDRWRRPWFLWLFLHFIVWRIRSTHKCIWSPVQPPTITNIHSPSSYPAITLQYYVQSPIHVRYKPYAYQTSQLNPVVHCNYHPLPASQPVTSQPQCTPITFSSNSRRWPPLSPDTIDYNSLLPPETVKQKYPKLRGPNRAGELAVKLVVEAFLGARCALQMHCGSGCRNLPGLSIKQLQKLLFSDRHHSFGITQEILTTKCGVLVLRASIKSARAYVNHKIMRTLDLSAWQ